MNNLIRICVVANNSTAASCASKSAFLAAETAVRIYDIMIRKVLANSGTFGNGAKGKDRGTHLDQEDSSFDISYKDLCVSATPKLASIQS